MSKYITHGHTRRNQPRSKEYTRWASMTQRCGNPNACGYHNYGGRGIAVCERWLGKRGFENFLADMGAPPTALHQIDRIDNDGNYEPSNCRWATKKEQANNRRLKTHIQFRGETKSVKAWAQEIGLSTATLRIRLAKPNWTIERALTTPLTPRTWVRITIDGVSYTAKEWARMSGISYNTVYFNAKQRIAGTASRRRRKDSRLNLI